MFRRPGSPLSRVLDIERSANLHRVISVKPKDTSGLVDSSWPRAGIDSRIQAQMVERQEHSLYLRVHGVEIMVRDPDGSLEFYVGPFGFHVLSDFRVGSGR